MEHLNLGPHDVTTIDTTAYLLPRQTHGEFYHKGDATMSNIEVSSSSNSSAEVDINEIENITMMQRGNRSKFNRNLRKDSKLLNKKKARKREKRMEIFDKTADIRKVRMSNNIQKKLQRNHRRRCKQEKEKMIRKKMQLKMNMRVVQKGVLTFQL